MSSYNKPIVVTVNDWKPCHIKYMAPKINDKGGKSITTISTQTNRSLHISTPLLMTWGIADFLDENAKSDGKFSISLNFPRDGDNTKQTDEFLNKLKEFENKILDDAVKNSELWFGEEMSREVVKHMFFPILKYSKNKDTKKFDYTKPPTIRAKVPNYNNKWEVEIYDTKSNLLFPSADNELISPVDLVPKLSQVACVLQASTIWIGGKGFGVIWKLKQCVVKPGAVETVFGKCHIQLSSEDMDKIDTQKIVEEYEVMNEEVVAPVVVRPVVETLATTTEVEDSDDEAKDEPEPVKQPIVAPLTLIDPSALPKKKKVVVKKPVV